MRQDVFVVLSLVGSYSAEISLVLFVISHIMIIPVYRGEKKSHSHYVASFLCKISVELFLIVV